MFVLRKLLYHLLQQGLPMWHRAASSRQIRTFLLQMILGAMLMICAAGALCYSCGKDEFRPSKGGPSWRLAQTAKLAYPHFVLNPVVHPHEFVP